MTSYLFMMTLHMMCLLKIKQSRWSTENKTLEKYRHFWAQGFGEQGRRAIHFQAAGEHWYFFSGEHS